MTDIAEKAINHVQKLVHNLLRNKLSKEDAERVSRELTEGKWTHDYPLTVEDLKSMKLPVEIGLPKDIYRLMELYPQPTRFTPGVEYIPTPYKKEPEVS